MQTKRFARIAIPAAAAGIALILLSLSLYTRYAGRALAQQPPPLPPGWPLVVAPEMPRPGEPAQVAVILHNDTATDIVRYAQFSWSGFGIGMERYPIGARQPFTLPAHGDGATSVMWIWPDEQPYCFYAEVFTSSEALQPVAFFQRNVLFQPHPDPGGGTFTEDLVFPLRNPLGSAATVTLTLPATPAGWQASVFPPEAYLNLGGVIDAHVVFTYTGGPLSPDGRQIIKVSGFANGVPIGELHKAFVPPVRLHVRSEPVYAESEISVEPYPVVAGAPAEICAEVRNLSSEPRQAFVTFRVAPFGIGLDFNPVVPPVAVSIPPQGMQRPCVVWVPPNSGQFAFEVEVESPPFPAERSQRVLDVNEVLEPGRETRSMFEVHNPRGEVVTIMLNLIRHIPGWEIVLDPPVLYTVGPYATVPVTMVVNPLGNPLPPDGTLVVDVEAFIEGELIGGFRKVYRPPVLIHRPADPIYAESEITINPYPPRAGEPIEICVELRNPTDYEQAVWVEFAWASFGIGLPWHPFHGQLVTLPPYSLIKKCTTWVPPFAGHFCAQVSLIDPQQQYPVVRSQRNMDVGEVLLPNQPTSFEFSVGNFLDGQPVTITLGMVPHLPDWQLELSQDVLPNVQPGGIRVVTLTVTPPADLPPDEQPIVDVEGYVGGSLIGGFRKVFRPPVPIHRPADPIYAESEITIHPYPPREREPTEICMEMRNPTNVSQTISVTFGVANFGIGLPFHDIVRPISVTLPLNSVKQVCVTWVPPFGGRFCAQATLQLAGHEPVWSQRNVDVGEVLLPNQPTSFEFSVGNFLDEQQPVTITLVQDQVTFSGIERCSP